ncbi:MAG: SDR family oxidoreductase [bacterium]|nr:SDR family oxidoreductase [bacterium]
MNSMTRLDGKTAVITGATNGIGQVTALELAKQGATVIVVGRSRARVDETVAMIRQAASPERVRGEVADLSLMADVRALAARLNADLPRIDLLINNAGAFFPERETTREGLEMTFALNHMNYFLLTSLLLDKLVASAPARIINVSSDAHKGATLDFADLQAQKGYFGFTHYSRSKLMNLYFTYELARRLQARGIGAEQVAVNALHPGVVNSGFFRNKRGIVGATILAFMSLVRLTGIMVTPEKGAQTTLYLATSDEGGRVTGKYFSNSKMIESSAASLDTAAAQRLWEMSEAIVEGRPTSQPMTV